MDVHVIGMVGGAFVAGTLVPYVFKKLMALRKKKQPPRRRRRVVHVHRRIQRFFPEVEAE